MKSSFILIILLFIVVLVYRVNTKNTAYNHCLKIKESLPDIDCEMFREDTNEEDKMTFLSSSSIKTNNIASIEDSIKMRTVDDIEIDLRLLENTGEIKRSMNDGKKEIPLGYFKVIKD